MIAREIYDLIKYHPHLRKSSQADLFTFFENACQSLLAIRNEEVDLLTVTSNKIYALEKLDEKFGIQAIDSKVAEKFPALSLESRLLLYRIIQNKIRLYNPEDYTFDTIRGSQYKRFNLISNLELSITSISPIQKASLFISQLGLTLRATTKRSLTFVSSLGLKLGFDPQKSIIYESTIRPLLSIISRTSSNLIYSQGLGLSLELQKTQSKTYTQDLGLRLTTFNETDYNRELVYTSELTLSLIIES